MSEDMNLKEIEDEIAKLRKAIGQVSQEIMKRKLVWMQEAKELGLYDKIADVCRYLGDSVAKSHGSLWIYPPEVARKTGGIILVGGGRIVGSGRNNVGKYPLVMTFDDYGGTVRVLVNGKPVAKLAPRSDTALGYEGFVNLSDRSWVDKVLELHKYARLARICADVYREIRYLVAELKDVMTDDDIAELEEARKRLSELCSKAKPSN